MKLTLAAILAVLSLSLGHAQTFGSSTGSTGATDVLNNGTTAFAWDVDDNSNNTSTTVNGVGFTGAFTQGAVTFSNSGFNSFDNNGINAVGGAGNAGFNYIQTDNIFSGNVGSISFSGLTAGDSYQLQIFAGTTIPSGVIGLSDGTATGSLAYGPGTTASDNDFIVENFVAPVGGTETIALSPTDGYIIVDALDLRDVPEPGTTAMLGVAMAALGALMMARRRAVRA